MDQAVDETQERLEMLGVELDDTCRRLGMGDSFQVWGVQAAGARLLAFEHTFHEYTSQYDTSRNQPLGPSELTGCGLIDVFG